MKVTIYLRSTSCSTSIRFYVEELGFFRVIQDYGLGNCLLQCRTVPEIYLYLAEGYNEPGLRPLFSLDVDDCRAEFARISALNLSAGRILPNKAGSLSIFEYPGGANFTLEDPDKNRFLINEDYSITE